MAVDKIATLLIMLIDLQKGTGSFCKKNLKIIEITTLELLFYRKFIKKIMVHFGNLWYNKNERKRKRKEVQQ